MSKTVTIKNCDYNTDELKHAFWMFLRNSNRTATDRTILTYSRDAFYILEKLPERWIAFFLFDTEYSDAEMKETLEFIIARDITADRKFPAKDARSYTKHFWNLVVFLRIISVVDNARAPRRIGE